MNLAKRLAELESTVRQCGRSMTLWAGCPERPIGELEAEAAQLGLGADDTLYVLQWKDPQ